MPSDQPPESDLLFKEEAAALMRTTPSHVENLVERGELAHYRIGRFLRIHRSDVEQYLVDARIDRITATKCSS